jgi:ATP-dependent Lhr-like helicase
MGELISARLGTSVRVRSDPYRIAFMFPGPSRPELVLETLRELSPKHLEGVLLLTLKNSSMFRWRLVHVAKRSGAVKRDADLTRINPRKLVESFSGTPVFYETYRELLVDKLDLEGAREVLLKIKRGEFELVQVSSTEPSVYAWYTLNQLSGGELIIPRRAEREILRAVCARLERKPITLFCLNCLGWKSRTRVGRLPERVRCGHCDAGLLTLLPKEHEPIVKLLREHARGKKLGRRDQELVERAFRIADLVLTHGRRALVVLAGRGVGPRAARRILSRSYRSEEDFYREILRAERTYARTRRFWEGK